VKPERSFLAARPLANHCAELLCAGAGSAVQSGPDLLRALAGRLADILPPRLAGLSGGEPPVIQPGEAEECDASALSGRIAPLAANCLLGGQAPGQAVLASIEAEAVFRMIDRAFGGAGRVPEPLPATFPLTAELMIARLESVLSAALAEAVPAAAPFLPLRRDASMPRLAPFPAAEPLALVTLSLAEADGAAWRITLAVPRDLLAQWSAARPHQKPEAGGVPSSPETPADPLAGPIGEVPLTLRAVLVDMPMAFSALSKLQPGQVIPVAVARNVPLCLAERVIAHGTVGGLDDRVALQINQLP
jgi:flagellar motor switch protein FliM